MRNRPSIAHFVIAAAIVAIYYKTCALPVGIWCLEAPMSFSDAVAMAQSVTHPDGLARGLMTPDVLCAFRDLYTFAGLAVPAVAGSIVLAIAWAAGKLIRARTARNGGAA